MAGLLTTELPERSKLCPKGEKANNLTKVKFSRAQSEVMKLNMTVDNESDVYEQRYYGVIMTVMQLP